MMVPAIANLLLGLIAIPFYIRYAQNKQIVDFPNHRSSHTKITPRGGGIFLAFGSILFACLSSFWLPYWPFLCVAFCIVTLGFIDDLKPLSAIFRLGIQIILVATIFWIIGRDLQFTSSEISSNFASASTLFTWVAMGLFTLWTVGCLNIYNFMDGIDGIAALQGIATTTAWTVIAYSSQNQFLYLLTLLLFGGLVAFLYYNWSPAKVFMGDGASSFLGFAFATMPLIHSKHTGIDLWVSMNLSALMLVPFLFDGTFTIFRRILNRENILQAHCSHLYQRWTLSGGSHRLVSSTYGLWAITGGISALLVYFEYLSLFLAYGIVLTPATALLIYSRKFPRSV